MSRSRLFLVLALLIIRSFNLAHPQRPAAVTENPPALIGSVIGSVYDEVTRLPIRFAEINLVPVPSKTEAPPAGNQPDAPQQRKRVVSRITGTSGIDGSFRLNVPPGDYLVAALKSGYIHPAATPAMDFSLSEDQLKKIIASQPQVHVGAGETASASLTLHRGAVISGRIQFADGSPAIDAPVACDLIDSVQRMESALRPENRGKVASPLQEALRSLAISQQDLPKFTTDDEGRYRIFGLLPGKYLVASAVVMDHRPGEVAMSDGSNPYTKGLAYMYPEVIPVYAPATSRRKDAKVFELHGDEQITDADLTIDSKGTHILRGRVVAAGDHHAPSTIIRIKEESAGEGPRMVQMEDDGSFQVNYLPSGNYTLTIFSTDAPNPANPAAQPTEYKTVRLTAIVTDHDVLLDDVLVVPLKPDEKRDFFDLLN